MRVLRLHSALALVLNPGALIWQAALFLAAFAVYSLIDFGEHFELPPDETGARPDWVTRLYFTCVTQFAISTPGEMFPKTSLGRALAWTHGTASIVQALSLFSFTLHRHAASAA